VIRYRPFRSIGTAAVALALVTSFIVAQAPRRATAAVGDAGAGGKAVAHYAGGRIIRGNDHGPVAKLFRMKDANGVPVNAGEPTLGVTNEDNVFYTAIQGNTRVEVMRSTNEGQTWEAVSPKLPNGRNAQLVSFDPYLWVDDTEGADRIFTIDLTVACAYLSFSDDEGKTWTTNPVACGRPVNDHQTLFSGPPAISPTLNFPNVVYYCWNDIGSSSCSKSLDGGITWVPTGSPAFSGYDPQAEDPGAPESPTGHRPANCGGLHGHGHVGQDGTVYIPKGHCGQPWLAISHDEGATWERVQVANNGVADHEASIATDAKGNIYYTYVGKDRLIYLVTSKDGGKTWSKPKMIAAPGVNESGIPSLDVGGVGKVAIAYMGTTNSPGQPFPESPGTSSNPDCIVAQLPCPPPEEYAQTTWNGYMTISSNALDKEPVFYSSTVNDPKDPLKRGTCGPGRCGLQILDFIDVVIAPDGEVWTAWVDACVLACAEKDGTQDSGSEAVVGHLVGGPNLR
jgi:hypothetical protein